MNPKHDTSLIMEMMRAHIEEMRQPVAQVAAAGERLNAKAAAANEASLAPTRYATMLTQGRRAMWFAGAASLVLISGAVAWRIADPSLPALESVANTAPAPTPLPVPFPAPSASRDGSPTPVVTNYVLFTEGKADLDGRTYAVTAGHEYARSDDTNYVKAWCYTGRTTSDGVQVQLTLGTLQPGSKPLQTTDPVTAAALGLTVEQERSLFTTCPWLPAQDSPATIIYRFSGEVTQQSVGALKQAVASGATIIELDSPGGDLSAGMEAFEELHSRGLTMRVTGSCYSACTSLLAAGGKREVVTGGVVGVHQWATEDSAAPADAMASLAQFTSAMLIEQFTRAGIAPQFFIAGATVPPSEMYELTETDLRDWNVVTASIS